MQNILIGVQVFCWQKFINQLRFALFSSRFARQKAQSAALEPGYSEQFQFKVP
jgi:hypothetical protein